jgi:16S rRNA (guanine966-N2)-methyltransferase
MTNNQIRIIAGTWRGRKIPFKDSEGLRPTSDRIRETLFNWLAPYIQSSHCLDLFAGSGALGLEALSRGAISVSFVETNKQACQNIKNALQELNAPQGKTYQQNALQFIKEQDINKFTIIFIDPPYANLKLHELMLLLEQQFDKERNNLIFYEHNTALDPSKLLQNWKVEKQKKAGKVFYYLLKRLPANTSK